MMSFPLPLVAGVEGLPSRKTKPPNFRIRTRAFLNWRGMRAKNRYPLFLIPRSLFGAGCGRKTGTHFFSSRGPYLARDAGEKPVPTFSHPAVLIWRGMRAKNRYPLFLIPL